jgi:hypothetical protein
LSNNFDKWIWSFIEIKLTSAQFEETRRLFIDKYAYEQKELTWIYDTCFLSVIHDDFCFLLIAAILGGIDNSPIARRKLEAYATGGIPGGLGR